MTPHAQTRARPVSDTRLDEREALALLKRLKTTLREERDALSANKIDSVIDIQPRKEAAIDAVSAASAEPVMHNAAQAAREDIREIQALAERNGALLKAVSIGLSSAVERLQQLKADTDSGTGTYRPDGLPERFSRQRGVYGKSA